MVAVFLRLKLQQLANSVRRPPTQLLGLVILLAYGVAATAFLANILSDLAAIDGTRARVVVVVGGSLLTAGYLLVPLFVGADDPADPRSFATLGVDAPRIASGLAVSALLGVPAILLFVVAVGQIDTWNAGGPTAFVGAVSAILITVTGVLGSRLARSVAAYYFPGRRARSVSGIVGLAFVLALTPFIIDLAMTDWQAEDALGNLSSLASVLGGTPLGLAWAAPADAAMGDIGGAYFKLLLAAGFVALLWIAWRALVNRMLTAPRRTLPDRESRGLGWFGVMPATRAGAIAARSFTYWIRDGRYRLALAVIPIVPILLVVPLLLAGVWWQNLALIPLPVMCLFLSWVIHNDVATDNTAIWLHIASHTTGWADRLGRAIPVLLVGIPLVIVGAPITAALYGVPEVLPAVYGVSSCVLLVGVGVSSYVSSRHPYPTVRPGDSPFAQPQSTSSVAGQSLSFFGTIGLSLPVLGLAGLTLAAGEPWNYLTLFVGLGTGVVVLYLGLGAGARAFATRAPELLAFSLRN
ncbi:MAG: transporter permease [Homoserinimonas sp.]|jgi:ABC-2 type transport system permease protein|nr:transporter permease [Homoserinimonas sp.]